MKLTEASLSNKKEWEDAGFQLPQFDRAKVIENTGKAPSWIHFGAGNIFRGFPAAALQSVLDQGLTDTGVMVAEGFDTEIIEKAYRPFDNLTALVLLKSDGSLEKKVVASVTHSLVAQSSHKDWDTLVEAFSNPSLQMVSFTITEKGYSLTNAAEEYIPPVARDLQEGPRGAQSLMGMITALCLERFSRGAAPLALVSMDNCSHNGTRLYEAVHRFALVWAESGMVPKEFLQYIENPEKISFPWSMIDKITPRPDAKVQEMLRKDGFEDTDVIVTGKNTWIAPFVNAEETEYLVIEDLFPNGRPPLEKGGIYFTDRDTVDKVEKMKVCTCLNPLHTALAVFGCLLSYKSISEEMKDAELLKLIEKLGYEEGMPVVVNPGIIRPEDFLEEVLKKRLPNPFLPDTPQRIACDTSQKLPVRFGETLKARQMQAELGLDSLISIPLVFAGWLRYLMGIDDKGLPFEPSPDPLLEKGTAAVAGISLGYKGPFSENLTGLLADKEIFGMDLFAAGMGEKVLQYFSEMISSTDGVRETLKKYL